MALIPPTATYIVSGGLGIALPGWVAPALSLASYVAARYLLMCWPTQVRFS